MPGFMDNSFMGDRSPEAAVGGETQMNWMPGGSTAPAPQTSKQTSGGFFGVASQAARTIPLMTGAANAAAGVASSSIAAPLGAFGPGAFVVGNVLFSLARTVFGFGKKKTPNAVFRSTPVGNTNNFEKGWYVQSQLGNIGFEDAGTKNIPDEQAFIDLAKGVASLDDVVAPYLGTKAVEKIRSGFAFQPPTLMPSEGLIEHRYISMLDFASDVSPAAKKARQTLNDAYQDYAIAEQSIKKVVSQKYAPQEEAKEEQGLMDYSVQNIRQTLQSTPAQMQEVVDAAYISYVDSGGIMGPEQFESAFTRNLQDSLQEEPSVEQKDQPENMGLQMLRDEIKRRNIKPSGNIGIRDFSAYLVGGLSGLSYADMVSGKGTATLNAATQKSGFGSAASGFMRNSFMG